MNADSQLAKSQHDLQRLREGDKIRRERDEAFRAVRCLFASVSQSHATEVRDGATMSG